MPLLESSNRTPQESGLGARETARVHACGAAGSHHDYRYLDRAVAAGRAGGAGSGKAGPVL